MAEGNTRWTSVQSWEQLEKFLAENPTYYVADTRRKEGRYRLLSATDRIGVSVDGRSVNAIGYKLEIRVEAEACDAQG